MYVLLARRKGSFCLAESLVSSAKEYVNGLESMPYGHNNLRMVVGHAFGCSDFNGRRDDDENNALKSVPVETPQSQ